MDHRAIFDRDAHLIGSDLARVHRIDFERFESVGPGGDCRAAHGVLVERRAELLMALGAVFIPNVSDIGFDVPKFGGIAPSRIGASESGIFRRQRRSAGRSFKPDSSRFGDELIDFRDTDSIGSAGQPPGGSTENRE